MPKGIYSRTDKHRELARKAFQSISRDQRISNLGRYALKGTVSPNKGKKGQKAWNKGLKGLQSWHNPIGLTHKGGTSPVKGRKFPQKSGENNPNWKGGVSSQDRIERVKFRKQIQKKVFERDDYTCQLCSARGVDLQVDHIQSWAEYVELRFNIENCRTLCMKCHYQITFGKPMPPTVRAWGHNLLKGEKYL